MAASWGAYVFISNLIPLYIIALIITRRWAGKPHRRLSVTRSFAYEPGLSKMARGVHVSDHLS
jgi:hypothetical protein